MPLKPGPKPLPEGERKEVVSIRLPQNLIDLIAALTPNRNKWIEDAIYDKLLRDGNKLNKRG
jgi:hypothetical protein